VVLVVLVVVVVAPPVVVVVGAVVVVVDVVVDVVVVAPPVVVVVAPPVVVVVAALVVVVVLGGSISLTPSLTNASTFASMVTASPDVVQPPLASAFENDFVNFDCAFETLWASLAGLGFLMFLPKAFNKPEAFFPAALALLDVQDAAGSVPACATEVAKPRNTTPKRIVRPRAMSCLLPKKGGRRKRHVAGDEVWRQASERAFPEAHPPKLRRI
jgi:hypothetical protein